MKTKNRVCLGAFAGAHGVKGHIKIKTFTQNERDIGAYGPVTSEDGARTFTLKIIKVLGPGFVLASTPDISSREEATALSSTRLYIDRSLLPDTDEDEFYLEDLVGLTVIDTDDKSHGRVTAIHNFGAGDIVEIKGLHGRKSALLLAFTKENFPDISLAQQQIVIATSALRDTGGEDPKAEAAADRETGEK